MPYTSPSRTRYTVSDPAHARRYAWVFFILSVLLLGSFSYLSIWGDDLDFASGALLFGAGFLFLFALSLGWRSYARFLERGDHAATLAFLLGQKGTDYDQAKIAVQSLLSFVSESSATMADPRSWPRQQRTAKFLGTDFEVYLYERDSRVASVRILRPHTSVAGVPADSP